MNERIRDAVAVVFILATFVFVIVALVWATVVNDWAFFVPFVLVVIGIAFASLFAWAFARLVR